MPLTVLHLEQQKLHTVLAILSAIGFKAAYGMANSVDPFWSGSALFAQTYLFHYLEIHTMFLYSCGNTASNNIPI